MITVNSIGRRAEIKVFVKKNDLVESFNETFSGLENYSGKDYDVNLYRGFTPLSKEFVIN